jgi:hypothetical protein
MEVLHERVVFEGEAAWDGFSEEATMDSAKVYLVFNRVEEGDYFIKAFEKKFDALEYATMEAEINELDEYAVLEKELF